MLFRLASRRYGIEVGAVREIVPFRRATRLPGAPPTVAGLVNVRGTVVTVLDLGMRLEHTAAAVPSAAIILLEHGGRVVGAAVDEVLDVRRLAEGEVEPEAAGLEPDGPVRGLGRVDGEIVLLLGAAEVMAQALVQSEERP